MTEKKENIEALKNKAINKGYIKGTYFKDIHTNAKCVVDELEWFDDSSDLRSNGYCIFCDGKWAKLINSSRGGFRPNAGRKPEGRTPYGRRVTPEERIKLDKLLNELRA